MKDLLFKISGFNEIDPFLMTITSASDHWMYISSSGCLTAGRQKPDYALFPYITDDLLHKNAGSTGPMTAIRFCKKNKHSLWQPFSSQIDDFKKERNLYKNSLGNKIKFEEFNHSNGLTFSYSWHSSEEFGFVRKAILKNDSDDAMQISLVDGLRNIMPAGVELRTQQSMSNLANAYKVSEYNQNYNYALFYLNALLLDTPEPGESLNTNIVWSYYDGKNEVSLNEKSVDKFILDGVFPKDHLLKGKSGSYLKYIEKELDPGERIYWYIIADVKKSQKDVTGTISYLKKPLSIKKKLEKSIEENYLAFEKYIGSADAFQCTNNIVNDLHHTANVTYNVLRGGVFLNNYKIKRDNFLDFVKKRDVQLWNNYSTKINELPDEFDIKLLKKFGDNSKNHSLMRLSREYLPLTLGRRHGDPSRPWNYFNIIVKDTNEQPKMYYEGNWRDIFQNWEALALSYPESIESMICIFLNATSIDGYNPYRITSEGIDWEVIEKDDSWSHIGYWNDHQIIYLLKLLEHSSDFYPGKLENLLCKKIFSYANIPYRIKSFKKMVENPKETIDFELDKHDYIMDLVQEIGSDGRLILDQENAVHHVNMFEKLLVLSLAKICNYVPGAGIWLNTQRPEWNDANNALVGNGTSMVTLYYLRRFLGYFNQLLCNIKISEIEVTSQVHWWFENVRKIITNDSKKHNAFSDGDRMSYLASLGKIFEKYRDKVRSSDLTKKESVSVEKAKDFITNFCMHVDDTIYLSKSEDNLFEAYKTVEINDKEETVNVKKLDLMLEGQVAALSSQVLGTSDILATLTSLFSSQLYRSDMKSFMLYPEKEATPFLNKNIIAPESLEKSKVLQKMISEENSLIVDVDHDGNCRFNSSFRNSFDLGHALNRLENEGILTGIDNKELEIIFEIFESVFNHREFTGRSGTMFSYEGIGSIYWHMISKLLLVTQECYFSMLKDSNTREHELNTVGSFYYRIRNGLSSDKTPAKYGAFPFDPYSHTPSHSGAQQPGMTGQVKEEILTRFGELGCLIEGGSIFFKPYLLRSNEFLLNRETFWYFDTTNRKINLSIEKNQLAYTYCQVPVIYSKTESGPSLKLTFRDGEVKIIKGNKIDPGTSESIFNRSGEVQRIDFDVDKKELFNKLSINK